MTGRRIAVVTDWFHPRRGGIEAQLLELCERLGARGDVVDVITSTPGAEDGRHFRVRLLPLLRLPLQDVVVSPRLVTALRRELARGYDVVHAHVSVVSPVGYAAAVVARCLGLPVVVTFHSVLHAKALALRAAHAISGVGDARVHWTAVSERVAGQASRALGGVGVSLLPNGVDLAYWREVERSPAAEAVTFVSAMRLQRKKRPRQLVRAFADAVLRASAPARLVLIGDGPDRAVVERDVAASGLREGPARVELLGWLDRDAMRVTYRRADAFVLASTAESFGIAALEARAAGLPVLAREGGATEFLAHERDALICRDDGELTAAMCRIIDDAPCRRRLAAAAPDLSRYDWAQVLVAHDDAFAVAMARASA